MSYRRAEACFVLLVGAALLYPSCSSSGIVGGDCVSGLSECHGHCIDLARDPNNCGACGHRCPSGAPCTLGVCPAAADAGQDGGDAASDVEQPDASLDGAEADAMPDSPADTTAADGPGEDASDGDVSEAGTDSGSDVETDACVEPYNTPAHCGACDVSCTEPPNLLCGQEFEGVWSCLPGCVRPLPDDCSGTCTDLNTDPFNCGTCDNVCPSGICSGGVCVGAGLGHVVLMCMDFAQSFRNQPPTTLLGNAVFLSARRPVRVLAYNRYTVAAVERQVNMTIGWAAPSLQSYDITVESVDDAVPDQLSPLNYDVFLVYDQPAAPPGTLGALGVAWASALASFASAGGTVIVLDGGGGEMWDFLANAALLEVTGEIPLSGQVYVRAGTDALAQRTVSPFRAQNQTCGFVTPIVPDFATVFVVSDTQSDSWGNPVVVHRAIVP